MFACSQPAGQIPLQIRTQVYKNQSQSRRFSFLKLFQDSRGMRGDWGYILYRAIRHWPPSMGALPMGGQ